MQKPVTETVQEQQCRTVQEQECETKYEEVCSGYGYSKSCRQVLYSD